MILAFAVARTSNPLSAVSNFDRYQFFHWGTAIWDQQTELLNNKVRSIVRLFEGTDIPNNDYRWCSWQSRTIAWHALRKMDEAIINCIKYRMNAHRFENSLTTPWDRTRDLLYGNMLVFHIAIVAFATQPSWPFLISLTWRVGNGDNFKFYVSLRPYLLDILAGIMTSAITVSEKS